MKKLHLSKKYIISIVLCLLLLVFLFIFNVIKGNQANQMKNKAESYSIEYSKASNEYDNKYKNLYQKYKDKAYDSNDPKVYSTLLSSKDYRDAISNINDFAYIFFNYKNSKEYSARKNKLLSKKLISKELANSSNFDLPKSSSGSDYINAVGLESHFDSADVYGNFGTKDENQSLLVKISFSSNYAGSSSSNTTNLYKINYNKKYHLVQSIEKISTISNDSE